MKILVITLDGLGDRPAPVLGGKTAVEAAHTPNLDALAKRGLNGLFTSVAPGVPAGTPTAHSLMFGYPLEEIPGRAVFHAVARDVIPKEGEVVSLTRYAAVEPGPEGLRLLERRMSAPEEDSRALAAAIRTYSHDGVDLELVYTGDTEGILILRGEVDDAVTDCDPMGSELPVIKAQPMDSARDPTRARKTAEAINAYLRWAHGVLRDHPVNRKRVDQGELPMNFMLAKWAGKRQNLPSFEGRWGLRAISLTSEEILIGVMHELGVETWTDEDHDIERDMVQRLTKAKALLDEGYDFVHVHTKEPDAIAHYGDPEKKKLAIDALDRGHAIPHGRAVATRGPGHVRHVGPLHAEPSGRAADARQVPRSARWGAGAHHHRRAQRVAGRRFGFQRAGRGPGQLGPGARRRSHAHPAEPGGADQCDWLATDASGHHAPAKQGGAV